MGGQASKNNKNLRVVILGPDAAGKTTLLYQIKAGRKIETQPTIGFNTETVKVKNKHLTLWDVGGQDYLRSYWKNYFHDVDILAYVIDASDSERLDEAKDALTLVLSDPKLDDTVLLIYTNKQDMDNVVNNTEIATRLGLTSMQNRRWVMQSSCATTGDGILAGLERAIKETKKLTKWRNQLAKLAIEATQVMMY